MAGVNAQADMDLNGLIKLGLGGLAAKLGGLGCLIELGAVNQLEALSVCFSVFHVLTPPP